jgi:hypothetical protein
MDVELQRNVVWKSRHGRRVPVRIDHRSRVGKRARELSQHFAKALTAAGRELTVDLLVAVARAAELTALAEAMRARMLRGDPTALADDCVRLQRLADQCVRRLALPTSAASRPAQTLGEYLQQQARQEPVGAPPMRQTGPEATTLPADPQNEPAGFLP